MHKIEVHITETNVVDFVNTVSKLHCRILLSNANGSYVNPKSMLGSVYAANNFDTQYCVSDEDISKHISKFIL